MYQDILLPDQIELLPLIREFKKEFYLVGGTAIALHLGHRRSIDFDYTEEVEFMDGFSVSKDEVENYLFDILKHKFIGYS